MKNLEQLQEDVMQAVTGSRRPVYRTPDNYSPFEKSNVDAAKFLSSAKDELMKGVMEKKESLTDRGLIFFDDIRDLVSEVLEKHFDEHMKFLPPAHAQKMREFLMLAVDAICTFMYGMIADIGFGASPEKLAERKSVVVEAAVNMSGFPAPISANLKKMLSDSYQTSFKDGDITDAVRRDFGRILKAGILNSDVDTAMTRRMTYCPAHDGIREFSDMVFDLVLAAYTHVHEQNRDKTGNVPHSTIVNVQLRLDLEALRNTLY